MPSPTLRALLYQTRYFSSHPLLRPFSTSEASGELWMGIKGNAATINPNTARAYYDTNYISTDVEELPEALRGPIWVGGARSYLAYGSDFRGDPRVEAGEELPWFLSPLSTDVEFMDVANPEKISPDLASKVQSDLRRALEILELLDGRGGVIDGVVDRFYNGSDLTSRSGANAVCEELKEARRVLDERIAAINFGLLHTQMGTLAWIDKRYGAYLRQWRTLGHMRGALLDLRDLQNEGAPILDMLDKGVPVYYPFGDPYRATLTGEEQQGILRASSRRLFCRWLALTCPRPALDFSLPDLWPTYRLPLEERLTDPAEVPPKRRVELVDDLGQRLKTALGDLVRPVAASPNLVPGNLPVLTVGEARLIVEPVSELRMMLWMINRRSSSITDALAEALARGWPFGLVYPPNFLTTIQIVRDRHLPAQLADVPRSIPDLESDYDIQEEWVKQRALAKRVAALPHARAFLFEGGVPRRLALLYGSEHVNDWLREGLIPSISVTSHRLGREERDGFRGDQASELESQLLLGTVRHLESGLLLSWFPSTEMLTRYGYCNGEWSNLAETLIRTRYDSLERGESHFRPLMETQWEEELSHSSVNRLLRESLAIPDQDEIDELLQEARDEMRTAWNSHSLDDIEIGIGRGEDAWWRN